jgi:hypothetical protein
MNIIGVNGLIGTGTALVAAGVPAYLGRWTGAT